MKIILINGPPRSGKDTAAKIIHDAYEGKLSRRWEKFSFPLKRAFAGLEGSRIDPQGNVEWYEDNKSSVIPWLGVSYRQWQMDFSEKFMKPVYGQDIFGRMFLERNKLGIADLVIVSDCGFQIEVDTVVRHTAPGDIAIFRIGRPETSFEGDSREWVSSNKVYEADILNNTTVEDLALKLHHEMEKFLGA